MNRLDTRKTKSSAATKQAMLDAARKRFSARKLRERWFALRDIAPREARDVGSASTLVSPYVFLAARKSVP